MDVHIYQMGCGGIKLVLANLVHRAPDLASLSIGLLKTSKTWLDTAAEGTILYKSGMVGLWPLSSGSQAWATIFSWKLAVRPGREIIPPLIDDFWITGPNGKHRCIVTSPAQMSLFDAKEASTFGPFRPKVGQSIIAQLIPGVAFLHHENIVHGDLHLGNILIQFPGVIDHFSTSELYERFGEPESEAVVRLDGKPLLDGVPARVFIPAQILLEDPSSPPTTGGQILGPALSFPSDIWTLACTVWEIFGQRPLFEAFFPSADRVTAEQVEVLSILPPEWWRTLGRRLEWFNEEGEMDLKSGTSRGNNGVRRTLDKRFEYCIQEPRAEAGLETAAEEERRAFERMLRSMLAFRPEERATAQQVLHSEWMKGWGLPALEQSWRTFDSHES
ncbi:hypothetical protein CNMCM5793_002776 [Aspergillus hiratsukae]|uniref:non-specific serine/threonine protein kinase n=1 Tax=Aspergillus hiratsukae TaxID=1194566 RepID=A0A8H6UHR8_9EURO|nr:hypothetical protein CNMCM5793_002776 [Aspergillus hiratsukae]KAF7167191.1 hypothetical protein CNMCM6106_002845 [Aspergillus hiratsukae]